MSMMAGSVGRGNGPIAAVQDLAKNIGMKAKIATPDGPGVNLSADHTGTQKILRHYSISTKVFASLMSNNNRAVAIAQEQRPGNMTGIKIANSESAATTGEGIAVQKMRVAYAKTSSTEMARNLASVTDNSM